MPSSPPTLPAPDAAPDPQGGWAAFCARHLFDYPANARRCWLVLTAAGLATLLWSLWALLLQPPARPWTFGIGLGLVALAAAFPVRLPRTTHSVVVAEVFIYTLLVTVGPAAAVLAAGIEALIGALRSSTRLTSRVSSPASAMLAMAAGGLAFTALRSAAQAAGLAPDVADFLALCVVAPLPASLTTVVLMGLVAVKRSQPLRVADWFAASTWYMGVTILSAFVAGLVYLNEIRYGPVVSIVGAALVFGLLLLLRVTLRRIDAEQQAQERLTAQARRQTQVAQQRFSDAFLHAAIGIAVVRPDDEVLQVNHALCQLLGRTEAELVGTSFCDVMDAGDAALFRRQVQAVVGSDDASFTMELRCITPAGADIWVALHCGRFADPEGSGHVLTYQLHDITSRHAAEQRLHHIAFHDDLTDLANRHCFHERLQVVVDNTRQHDGRRFAVLYLDLDRFKRVNDSLGHVAGNRLLREVARRLQACVRPGDLVARLGGDEFAVLLQAVADADDVLCLAQRVLQSLSTPLSINGTELLPGASIGIALGDPGYQWAEDVVRDADLAMYEAKAGGRGRALLFESAMHERVAQKLALEADLRKAIGEGQLSVQFQPLFELNPHRLCGFEALARWEHPQRGLVSPAVFIALAEESGHIEALTDWVIEQALAHLGRWRRSVPGADHLGVNVNISGRDLSRPDLCSLVQAALLRHELGAGALTLEITETTLMGNLDVAVRTMEALRASGVRFSIDDFGTGYSSLAYLSTLPIDSLKIDRSFVSGLHDKPQNIEIVRAVLMLARSLGRRVVAEGIETGRQLATLRTLGVQVGQGYLLSRPLPAERVPDLLAVELPAADLQTA